MKTEQTRAASNGPTADSPGFDAALVSAKPAARRRWKRWGAAAVRAVVVVGGVVNPVTPGPGFRL